MGHQNLNNQTIIAPNKYLFGDKSSKKANPTIIATVAFGVVIFVTFLAVRHVYLISSSGYHNMNPVPTASPSLHTETRNRYSSILSVRNQRQTKSSGLVQAETSLFERYPNASNKGILVVDKDF